MTRVGDDVEVADQEGGVIKIGKPKRDIPSMAGPPDLHLSVWWHVPPLSLCCPLSTDRLLLLISRGHADMFHTHLETDEGYTVLVPNGDVMDGNIINSSSFGHVRVVRSLDML